MKKRKIKKPSKPQVILVIILLALLLLIGYIWKIISTADYFKIREIITKEPNSIDLSYLKGKNIFSVDLGREAGNILEYYPNCINIRLARILPNRIYVDFIKRKPAAVVKLYKPFILDEDGVLFYAPVKPEQDLGLPIITGLETRIIGPKPGKRYRIKEIVLALNIINEVKNNPVLKGYKIQKIDVSSPDSTIIYMPLSAKVLDIQKGQVVVGPENLEVRIGDENIKDKVMILSGVLSQVKSDLPNIKYIDLRFKEPVIKFKDVKQ